MKPKLQEWTVETAEALPHDPVITNNTMTPKQQEIKEKISELDLMQMAVVVNPVNLAIYLAEQAQRIEDLYSILTPSQRIEINKRKI